MVNVVKEAQEDNKAVLIDARPHAKFKQETIPGAISIVDVQMKELKGRFPSDKSTPIITFCQGYDCKKSHNLAAYLKELGYTNVSNYSAGVPDWKKAKLKTTKAVCDTNATKPKTGLTNPTFGSLRKGLDVGSVDGEWFKENYATLKDVKIIDVRTKDEVQKGMLKGATNISIEENSAEDFVKALPDDYIAFYCGSGARAMEAYQKASKAGKKALYLDAAVKCENDACTIAPNEPLEPSDW